MLAAQVAVSPVPEVVIFALVSSQSFAVITPSQSASSETAVDKLLLSSQSSDVSIPSQSASSAIASKVASASLQSFHAKFHLHLGQ